jgi:hypothetical protein
MPKVVCNTCGEKPSATARQISTTGESLRRPDSFSETVPHSPETGPGTIVKWEAGAGPNGPVAALLSLIAVGCDRYPLGEEIISAGDAELFRAMMRAGIIRKLSPTGAGFRSRDPGPPDSFKQRRLHLTACQNWTHRRPPY